MGVHRKFSAPLPQLWDGWWFGEAIVLAVAVAVVEWKRGDRVWEVQPVIAGWGIWIQKAIFGGKFRMNNPNGYRQKH
jgi:hypothetical protein